MSAGAQYSGCLGEADGRVDPVKRTARKDGVEACSAGIPGLERCRHDVDVRGGRKVRPRSLGELRPQLYPDDLESSCCELSRGLARAGSDLEDH